MSKHVGKKLGAGLQVLISTCLIVFVFLSIDLSQVTALAFHPQRAPMLIAAFIAFNASKIVGALRLNIYQRHAAIHLSECDNLRLYYAGMFVNLFLPGGIGGDGYKIVVLHRSHALPLRAVVMITLADRVSGILALLFMLCILMPMLSLPWGAAGAIVFALASGAAVAAVFISAHQRFMKLDVHGLASVFVLGLAVQFLQMVCMGMLLLYLGTPATHYLAYLAIFLMSSVAAVLPLGFGGLGVREATFLFGASVVHLDPAYGVIASSWFFLITALSSLIGSLFLSQFSLQSPTTKL